MLSACSSENFESDKRQLTAKRVIREKLGQVKEFDIRSFKEDTIKSSDDKPLLQYTLQVTFIDSAGTVHNNKGLVIFTEQGNQVISSSIVPE